MSKNEAKNKKMTKSGVSPVRVLVEAAMMIAIATVLSILKLIDLPYGGGVTIAAMLPIIIISYRHGLGWGFLTGLVFGIIQQLLGLDNLGWVTGWISILAVILLDYVLAYMMTGLGGTFRKSMKQPYALLFGAVLVGLVRYIFHVIAGATVWAELPIPTAASIVYSLSYNATYMIPETIITAVAAFYLGTVVDFRRVNLGNYEEDDAPTDIQWMKWIAGLLVTCVIIADVYLVFPHLQDAETGEFILNGLKEVNWTLFGIVTGAGFVIAIVLYVLSKNLRKKKA
ncbi:MAG: energy-coupled thiamine transporter ThiT [Lachnospiraceae bacterium]|nr:energy-coupled thiamine transporter ThiT [Lachnospiraceae bacterium]